MMERRTSRCPAACSRFDFASWIAGFFSSVVWRTVSSVTPCAVGQVDTQEVPMSAIAKHFDFIARLVLQEVVPHQTPALLCGFDSARCLLLTRTRVLLD